MYVCMWTHVCYLKYNLQFCSWKLLFLFLSTLAVKQVWASLWNTVALLTCDCLRLDSRFLETFSCSVFCFGILKFNVLDLLCVGVDLSTLALIIVGSSVVVLKLQYNIWFGVVLLFTLFSNKWGQISYEFENVMQKIKIWKK